MAAATTDSSGYHSLYVDSNLDMTEQGLTSSATDDPGGTWTTTTTSTTSSSLLLDIQISSSKALNTVLNSNSSSIAYKATTQPLSTLLVVDNTNAAQHTGGDASLSYLWNTSTPNVYNPSDVAYDALNGSTDDVNTSLQQIVQTEMLFIDIMGIWVTGLFCLLGIAGNVLSFIVLVRAFGKSPMFFVLRAVAVSDAIFLASVFVMQTLVNMYPFTGVLEVCFLYRGYIQFAIWPLLMMTQMSTVWLTILVSIERYIAICFPLKSAHLLSFTRIKRAVAFVFIVSILYNIPRYFEYKVLPDNYSYIDKTAIATNAFYRYIYMCTLYLLVLFLIPLALLIILNLKLVLALQQGKKQWQKLHSRQKREQTLTIIPLTIVLVFFICGTPALVVNIIESMSPNIHDINFVRFLVTANLLVVLNSACNFIIYCMLGKRFRTKLLELCRCQDGKKKHSYQVVQQLVTSQITDV